MPRRFSTTEIIVVAGIVFSGIGIVVLTIADVATCTKWDTRMVEQTDCIEIFEGQHSCTTRMVPESYCISRE